MSPGGEPLGRVVDSGDADRDFGEFRRFGGREHWAPGRKRKDEDEDKDKDEDEDKDDD